MRAIKLVEDEIERQIIFLKAETDQDEIIEFCKTVVHLDKSLSVLNRHGK